MAAYQDIYDLFETWLSGHTLYSKVTVHSYLKITRNFLLYLENFGILRLNEVDKEIITQFAHFKSSGEKYAVAFVAVRLAALNLFFTWTHEKRYSRDNPLISYRKAKIQPIPLVKREGRLLLPEPVILSAREQQSVLNLPITTDLITIRNKAIVALILGSGLYAEEVIALAVADVDLKGGYVNIQGEERRERQVRLDRALCQESCERWLQIRNNRL